MQQPIFTAQQICYKIATKYKLCCSRLRISAVSASARWWLESSCCRQRECVPSRTQASVARSQLDWVAHAAGSAQSTLQTVSQLSTSLWCSSQSTTMLHLTCV